MYIVHNEAFNREVGSSGTTGRESPNSFVSKSV